MTIACRTNFVFSKCSIARNTASHCVEKFRNENFEIKSESRGRPSGQEYKEQPRAMIEADLSPRAWELARRGGLYKNVILFLLGQIHKIKKLEKRLPHDLSDDKKRRRDAYLFSLSRYNGELFVH